MTPISRLGQLALLLSLVTGCEERATIEDVIPPIPDDSYVEVMAELTRIRRRPPTARGQIERDRLADSVRTEVLNRHGVTVAEIIEFADVVGSDPGRMQDLAERIATLADSLDADSTRVDSVRAVPIRGDPAAPSARFDRLDGEAGTDTLDARGERIAEDSSEIQGGDPGLGSGIPSLAVPSVANPSFAIPGLAIPADSGIRIKSTAADDTLTEVDAPSPTDSAVTRRRPGGGRRPARRPLQTPEPDSTPGQSNNGATGDDAGAV
jgi:hypothetical protein